MKLVEEKSKFLREICPDFNFGDKNLNPKKIAEGMFKIMIEENGLGLAAPQIGETHRVFVMGLEGEEFICFNPEVLEESDEQELNEEGCLSFPGLYVKVKRPKKIKARYQDEKGEMHERELEDLWARCFLHELDHLNGIVFVDKVGKVALDLAKRRRKKYLRERSKNG